MSAGTLSEMETPFSIPNKEVKHLSVDDTPPMAEESRSVPAPKLQALLLSYVILKISHTYDISHQWDKLLTKDDF